MRTFARAAVVAAGLAAVSAVAAPAPGNERLAPSLLSFSVAKAASAYELSATGVAGVSIRSDLAETLNGAAAASRALSGNLALDTGRGLDIAARFAGDGTPSPFLSAVEMPYLGLANGGRYGGLTFVPAANLRLRAGASFSSERLDHFSFDPLTPDGPLALTYDAAQSRSLLAGASWQSGALGLDLAAISSERSGVPLGFADAATLSPKAATNAVSVAAHMSLGAGWVTTASFSDGMTQLDQRSLGAGAAALREQSYSLAIAKHGLFGDDSLGLALSRPAPGLVSAFGVASEGEPALVISQNPALSGNRASETDIQLGYVTNFLDGAVALQTNAAYQTNFQGQRGATSVSLLSRAKIKF
jgi:hypothetical protein